ncbi:hypothetical protein ACFO3J_20710 [Streptomyces polygonati]|uniref:Uncharacterized protein n=1 Tax=Streptomyces polygonati TaxID=1617087 RepID=A0ABV8HSD6_9ACTN
MGLFSSKTSSGRGSGEVGRFVSPHSAQDTLKVVHKGLAGQLSTPEFAVSASGPMAAIFISRLGDDGITVTAGNTVETYFEFRVDLTATANGCEGHAYFDRPDRQITRWMGNTIGINVGVLMALEAASVTIGAWRTG